jgi:membrane-associated phospholipid phosphatase
VPAIYLVAGYWVPALLVPTLVRPWFGVWLRRSDTDWPWPTVSWPRWALASFEVGYLMCYAVVATGFAIIWFLAGEAEVGRFWFAVLAAGFLCFMTLPWLVSRPPRLLDDAQVPAGSVAALNRLMLRRVTHEFNTFPSGHVAVAAAAALSTLSVSWLAGVVLGVVTVGVGLGAVTGGYHYRIDVVLAVAVAIGATSWSRFL